PLAAIVRGGAGPAAPHEVGEDLCGLTGHDDGFRAVPVVLRRAGAVGAVLVPVEELQLVVGRDALLLPDGGDVVEQAVDDRGGEVECGRTDPQVERVDEHFAGPQPRDVRGDDVVTAARHDPVGPV